MDNRSFIICTRCKMPEKLLFTSSYCDCKIQVEEKTIRSFKIPRVIFYPNAYSFSFPMNQEDLEAGL